VHKVHVIGIGFRPLERAAHDALVSSDVVLANNRLVDVFRSYDEFDQVSKSLLVHRTVYDMLDYIAENYTRRRLSVLAAGDPMFFGVGRLIVERLGREAVEVHPDLSSLQVAFSRIKETSNNALLISLHGGPDPEKRRQLEYELSELPALIKRYEKIGILTDRENSPSVIASALQSSIVNSKSSIKMFVCEKLGYPDEKVTEGTPAEITRLTFENPNVVIVRKSGGEEVQKDKPSALPGFRVSKPAFGLKEDEIVHSGGLITKDEVRAVTIHKLRLPGTGVLWDIGAGSGSVAIEAARICPEMMVYAVEKVPKRVETIHENVRRLEVSNLKVVEGMAPDALADLPDPDRVFIGGSSGGMREIIDHLSAVMPAGVVVVNAATIETLNEAVEALEGNLFEIEVTEVSVSRSKEISGKRHMSALNPVFIIRGVKK
jgi:precorrin-6Y C5,15-methyltransferase (decarboxylating)